MIIFNRGTFIAWKRTKIYVTITLSLAKPPALYNANTMVEIDKVWECIVENNIELIQNACRFSLITVDVKIDVILNYLQTNM